LKLINKKIKISCDGGGATGKSTGAKMIAKKYKLKFLSSGLLYRYAGFLLIKHKPKNQITFLKQKFKNLNYKEINKINLHTPEISKKTSSIAKINKVRKILKTFQTKFADKLNKEGEFTGGVYNPGNKHLSVKVMGHPIKIPGQGNNQDLARAIHAKILSNSPSYKPDCEFHYSKKESTKHHTKGL